MLRAFVLTDGEFFGDGTRYVMLDDCCDEVFLEMWDGEVVELPSQNFDWVWEKVEKGIWEEIDLNDDDACLYYAEQYIKRLIEKGRKRATNDRQLDGAGIRMFSIDEVASGALEEVFGPPEG